MFCGNTPGIKTTSLLQCPRLHSKYHIKSPQVQSYSQKASGKGNPVGNLASCCFWNKSHFPPQHRQCYAWSSKHTSALILSSLSDQTVCHTTDPSLVTHFRAYSTFGKQHFLTYLYINSQICCSSGFILQQFYRTQRQIGRLFWHFWHCFYTSLKYIFFPS